MVYSIIGLCVYVLGIGILAYTGYKKTKNKNDYLLAGKGVHPIVMALSYGATFVSTSAIVGFGGAAGQFGLSLLWLTLLTIIVGVFIAFVVFGKKTRQLGHELEAYTMPEMFGKRFNSKFLWGYSSILIVVFMPVYASAVIKGMVDFVSSYFSVNPDVVLVIIAVCAVLYVITGGLKGIMYADAFQGGLMFLGMAFLLIFTYSMLGGIGNAHAALSELSANPEVTAQTGKIAAGGFTGWSSMPVTGSPIWWNVMTTLVAGVGIGVLAQPQLAVRFMTVKSGKELNRATLSGGIFIFMMTGTAFVVGALSNVKFFDDTGKIAIAAAGANDSIIPVFVKSYLPEWFSGLFIIIMLAASLSTVSALAHTIGTSFGRDFMKNTLGSKLKTISATRIGIALGIVISAVLSFLSSRLDVSMAIIAQGTSLFYGLCAAAFLPTYTAALYIKSFPKQAAVASMVTGSATSILWAFFINEKSASAMQLCRLITGKSSLFAETSLSFLSMADALVIALPVSIIVAVAVHFYCKTKKK